MYHETRPPDSYHPLLSALNFPMTGKRRMVVVIGGALGLAESVRRKAGQVWSLSSLVMAGGVARIVLLEGIYRAYTVVENHPYHNE